ncbi:hypothetical protein RJ640_003210 [Escallonia rubra]|uniref:Late embryogenesis abundant protein LEA-2 subgroup domain-containing protein n=1 Tax=Escallonia rubra TaxID=112253 RepID=A0AA88RGY3_9ASTE|nr:hypothetical protein RJ640_003210 [Escallonia rubra]
MSNLNGAYYGPSIPPPSKTYHRPGKGGGGGGCCGLFSCCCGCLCSCIFNLIFQILFTIAVIIGAVVLVIWLIFRPSNVKFHVTDTTLTQFDFSTANNTLYYNLALNMSIRNPNKRIGIYYDSIEARAFYNGQRFAATPLDKFYQGHKKTNNLTAEFKGQNVVTLGSKEVSNYDEDKGSRVYGIDLKLYLKIRLKFGWIKTTKFKPKIKCDLKVPLESNGVSSVGFQATRSSGIVNLAQRHCKP